jgi:CCR4-NOT transcriptional regulation complex NOT5 subunit
MKPVKSTLDPYTDPFINEFLRSEMKKLRQQQQTIIFKGDISNESKRLLNRPSIESGLEEGSTRQLKVRRFSQQAES